MFIICWYSECTHGGRALIVEGTVRKLYQLCRHLYFCSKHTVPGILQFMKEVWSRDKAYRNKIVFEDD